MISFTENLIHIHGDVEYVRICIYLYNVHNTMYMYIGRAHIYVVSHHCKSRCKCCCTYLYLEKEICFSYSSYTMILWNTYWMYTKYKDTINTSLLECVYVYYEYSSIYKHALWIGKLCVNILFHIYLPIQESFFFHPTDDRAFFIVIVGIVIIVFSYSKYKI